MIARLHLIAAFGCAATGALAQDTLYFGTDGAFPPSVYIDDAGTLAGTEPEMLALLCAELSLDCQWTIMPFSDLEAALEAGEIDAILASLSPTPERSARMVFTRNYYRSEPDYFAFIPSDRPLPKSVDTASIGAQIGSIHADYVADHTGGTLVTFATQIETIQALASGKVDLIFASNAWLGEMANMHNILQYGAAVTDLAGGAAIAFAPQNAALAARFSAVIDVIEADGRLDQLRSGDNGG
ncbi:MAG: transporter substrate-binding domain-containing protein [Rhodobacteraceae bacterium]|nr:transporter substrate-binding domain-containing protein [Paracoccaceae bacterium]